MASHHPSQPHPDDRWPVCDEQPPGISIRPLRHDDLQALLFQLDHHEHDQDQGDTLGPGGLAPVVAVRVRASVGRPGASAHAEYRRRRPLNAPAGSAACPGGLERCWPPA